MGIVSRKFLALKLENGYFSINVSSFLFQKNISENYEKNLAPVNDLEWMWLVSYLSGVSSCEPKALKRESIHMHLSELLYDHHNEHTSPFVSVLNSFNIVPVLKFAVCSCDIFCWLNMTLSNSGSLHIHIIDWVSWQTAFNNLVTQKKSKQKT